LKLKTFSCLAFCLALLAAAVYYAPFFLIVSDQPVKSDAVVLFLGGEKGTREKEANQLVADGYADYLIIPAYKQIKKRGPNGKLESISSDIKAKTSYLKPALVSAPNQQTNELMNQRTTSSRLNQPTNERTNQRNRFVEDTHEEALIAKDMMEHEGISSAILVSSPYHMRRIKIIAGKVFGNSPPLEKGGRGDLDSSGERYRFTFVPTRYETSGETFWLFNNYDRKFVTTEYMKIGWFVLYSSFV
jgi:hypothetical protein